MWKTQYTLSKISDDCAFAKELYLFLKSSSINPIINCNKYDYN
jgi:hypothetical protein